MIFGLFKPKMSFWSKIASKWVFWGGQLVIFKCQNTVFFYFFWIFSSRFLKCASWAIFHIESICNHHLHMHVHMDDHNSAFFCLFWAKLTKRVIFTHKYGQKYHFGVCFMKRPLCQIESICVSKFPEKFFFEVWQLHIAMYSYCACT